MTKKQGRKEDHKELRESSQPPSRSRDTKAVPSKKPRPSDDTTRPETRAHPKDD